jgi:hypothetical protein
MSSDRYSESRFVDAPAPMTAKCIIRDEIAFPGSRISAAKASAITATIVSALKAEGYEIKAREAK